MPLRFTPRRSLGQTGFHASLLGIGDLADRRIPLDTCVATVHRAMDAGLNVIDTAPGYEDGYSEEIVRASLQGRRDGMFVIDKIDALMDPVGPQVDRSLRSLGVDHVDLFVFHGLSDVDLWRTIVAPGSRMDELADCIKRGKARFRGISSHSPDVLRAAIPSGLCDVVMFPVGPYVHPDYVEQILPLARQHNVGTVCFKTFGAGKLLGDTSGYNQPLKNRPRGKVSSGGDVNAEHVLPRMSVEDCLHYTLTLDPDVTLLGLSFPEEQDAAFTAAASFRPLSAQRMHDIHARALLAIQDKGPCWWNPGGK